VGAVSVVLANWLAGRQERQLEREKWKQGQEDAVADSVIELTSHLAAAAQEITWFTADAKL
jgi:hypothetical protein